MVKLLVSFLPETVTVEMLHHEFGRYGHVSNVGIFLRGRHGFVVSIIMSPARGH